MKIKGTIHLVHEGENSWCFKYEKEGTTNRVPFIYYTGKYEEGQEIECYIETLVGIERAKPLFPIPNSPEILF